MPTVREQIEAYETLVASFSEQYRAIYNDFNSDKNISPKEAQVLSKIKAKVDKAVAKVQQLRAEFETNRANWYNREHELTELQNQARDLRKWGDPVCADIDTDIGVITNTLGDENYRDSLTQLDTARGRAAGPYEEYQYQLPFFEAYKTALPDCKSRFATLEAAPYRVMARNLPTHENISKNISDAEARAKDRLFDQATQALNEAGSQCTTLEEQYAHMAEQEKKARSLNETLLASIKSTGSGEFKEIDKSCEELGSGASQIDSIIGAFEFDKAFGEIEAKEKALGEVQKRKAELEADKKKWEGRAGELADAVSKIKEMFEWDGAKSGELDRMVGDAKAAADAQNYKDADSKFDAGAHQVGEAYGEYKKQMKAKKIYFEYKAQYDMQFRIVVLHFKSGQHLNEYVKRNGKTYHDSASKLYKKAEELASEKEFIGASACMGQAVGFASAARAIVQDLEEKYASAEERLSALKEKMTGALDTGFKSLADKAAEVADHAAGVQSFWDALEIDKVAGAAKGATDKADALIKEAAKLTEEKKRWEARKSECDDAEAQMREIQEWGIETVDSIRSMLDAALGDAEKETWPDAEKKLEKCKSDIAPLKEKVDEQKRAKAEYETKRRDYDSRLAKADKPEFTNGLIKGLQSAVGSYGIQMDMRVEKKDFTGALEALESYLPDLVKLEAEIAREAGKQMGPKGVYEPMMVDFARRFKQAEADAKAIGGPWPGVVFVLAPTEKLCEQKLGPDKDNFDEALDELLHWTAELSRIEGLVEKEKQKRSEAQSMLSDLKAKASEAGGSAFKTLADAAKSVADGVSQADSHFEQCSFDEVKSQVKAMSGAVTQFAADSAKLAAEKASWDGAKSSLDLVKARAKELQNWGMKGAEAIRDAADGAAKKASDENWFDAVKDALKCKQDIGPFWEKYQEELQWEKDYNAILASFLPRYNGALADALAKHQLVKIHLENAKPPYLVAMDFASNKREFKAAASQIKMADTHLRLAESSIKTLAEDV